MKKIFTLLLLIGFNYGVAHAQCVEAPTNKVLLVGDSWAAFMSGDATITDGLKIVGHSDKKFTSTLSIAENGADTWDFVAGPKLDDIQNIIDANPEIEMVHLSIGGNDLLGDWHITYTQAQTDSLALEVQGRLETIIDFLQNTRPGMHVFWPGYAYPNFGEVIGDMGSAASVHPFYGTWDGMGQPDFATINGILNDMSDSVANYADGDPLFDFVRGQGILQYTYGQAAPLTVAPGGTYPAFSVPLPLGDPTYPSPKETMRPYLGLFTDCFHLSKEAYLTLFVYQAEKFYQKFFMDDLYLFSSGGDMDGSVSSAGDVSQEIKLGEDGGNEFAAVVSFDTQGMADTTLSNASIFLRRESTSGTNPIAANDVVVKMVSGNFGTTANVEAVDFMETGDASGEPCKGGSFNNNAEDGHWVRLDLTAEMLLNITNDEPVQFMISIPGFTGGTITFNDATTNPDWAPILNLNYGPAPQEPSGINDIYTSELPVYPIPTTGPLTIDVNSNSVQSIEVFNVLGSVVLTPEVNDNRIDITGLPTGSYVLRITTNEGISTKRIIKR